MPPKLDKLRVVAFRGASTELDIDFDSTRPVCLLFGENGSGKSSIVDSLDFVCNGSLGSLKHCKLGSAFRKERFIPTINRTDKDVRVEITAGGTTWTARHSKNGVTLCSTANRPRAMILRRAELLDFVEAERADRYRQLASFIAVREVEVGEQALCDVCTSLKKEVQEAIRASEQAKRALEQYWEGEGRPDGSYLQWSEREAQKQTDQLRASVDNCTGLLKRIATIQHHAITLEKADAEVNEATVCHEAALKAVSEAATTLAKGAGELLQTLKDAQAYIEANPAAAECPVCEKPIDRALFSGRLQQRVESLAKLEQATLQAQNTESSLNQAAARQSGAQRATFDALRTAGREIKACTLPEITGQAIQWTDFKDLLDESQDVLGSYSTSQGAAFRPIVMGLEPALKSRLGADQKTLNQLAAIRQHVQAVRKNTETLRDLNAVKGLADQAVVIVEKHRKQFIDELLTSVSGEVDALYAKVHPGEAIGGLRLYLDPKQRGSLKFEGTFETETAIPPQAYYSESHLDTLGACIFLALAKKFSGQYGIVVIDDVFTSIDQRHMDRLIRLIHDEAEALGQLIVTTHYRPWREMYRYNKVPGLKVQIVDLLPWSLNGGVRHTRTKLVIEDLQQCLAALPFDRQQVASRAGILLESMLDHLTLVYQCKMPRRPNAAYTLGDLLAGIDSKLAKAMKTSQTPVLPNTASKEQELKPLLDEIGSMTWIRNQVGCHFSDPGMDTADSRVEEFGKKTCEFAGALVCSSCGELPRSDKSGVDRMCRCGDLRLVPLQQPT